jgi:hypothetical protein
MLSLDLSQIPTNRQDEAKEEVGEFVVNEILRSVSSGRSPVGGRGSFDKLNRQYAEDMKGGNRTPNLELEGDLLDSLRFESTTGGIEVGIFNATEQGKADGHNNFSGRSKLPTRRFIPWTDETFNPKITRGIDQILDKYRQRERVAPEDIFEAGELALGAMALEPDLTIDDILGPLITGGLFGER